MSRREELWKDTIKQFEFACYSIEQLIGKVMRIQEIFDRLEDERMVADLSKLHNRILQSLHARLVRPARLAAVRMRDEHTILLHLLVELALQRGHLASDQALDLVWQLGLDVLLERSS